MAIEQTQHTATPSTFVDEGKALLADVIDATEEGREAQGIKNRLNLAGLLSKVPALSGLRPNATAEEREQARYEAFAKIEIGEEIGLKPAESLRAIYFDQNGPGIEVHTRVAMAVRGGRYKFDIVRLDHDACEIQWYRRDVTGWEPMALLRTNIEQLKHIDVWEKGKQVKLADKWNYKSWREDMMYAFLQRRAVRRFAPETQGSYVPRPVDDEAYEDAGFVDDAPMTAARHTQNVTDMTGSDGTPDTAAQDAAKRDASPEATAQRERAAALLDIRLARDDFKIETSPFFAWLDASASQPGAMLDIGEGLAQASIETLHRIHQHLCLYESESCAVLLGQDVMDPDEAWERAQEIAMDSLQPPTDPAGPAILPGLDEATARSEEKY